MADQQQQRQTWDELGATLPKPILDEVVAFMTVNPRPEPYMPYLNEAVARVLSSDAAATSSEALTRLNVIVYCLYGATLPLPTSRAAFSHLTVAIQKLPTQVFRHAAAFLLLVHHAPGNPRTVAYEGTLITVRHRLSSVYEQDGDFKRAAEILVCIPSDTISTLPGNGLLRYNLRICYFYTRYGDVDKADLYHNRASTYYKNCNDDTLMIAHGVYHARILDLKCRFEDAAAKYYSLAHEPRSATLFGAMSDAEVPALSHAITCAILAPAGPRRSRLLAMLYNDDRSRRLEIFPLLESIHKERLLQQDQVDLFRPTLLPHQHAQHPDGDTVLDRAVIEHNLLAVSKMYTNIGLKQLGDLLGCSPRKAESIAHTMIYEKRMIASIDQVECLVEFSNDSHVSPIEKWDKNIASFCGAVDDCVDAIIDRFPQSALFLSSGSM